MVEIGTAVFTAITYMLTLEIKHFMDIESNVKEEPNLFPDPEIYDFIIVGAGSAGCFLAEKLSESHTVLLLEAGGPQPPLLDIPAFRAFSYQPEINYLYKSTPQLLANNQSISNPQGKMMGGSGAHNGLVWNRGNSRDYDNWAVLTNDSSWTYENILPIFKKIESYSGAFNSNQRGHHGPIPVITSSPPILNTYIEAASEAGYGYYDPNGPQHEGLAATDYSVIRGRAVSTCTLLINPILGERKNLHVKTYSEATKILTVPGSVNGKPSAIGVKYKKNGNERDAYATKEVILSSGVLGSPMILFKSGIGPATMLNEAEIDVVADLPVGKHLYDHPGLAFTYSINDPSKLYNIYNNLTDDDFQRYLNYGDDGFLSDPGYGPQGFFVTPNAIAAGEENWPDIQFFHAESWTSTNTFLSVVSLTRSTGFGEVSLDTNAWLAGERDNVNLTLMNARFLEEPTDRESLLQGIRIVQQLFNTTVFKELGIELVPLAGCVNNTVDSDEYWYCAIASTASMNHITGTCRMGGEEDETAVVDTDFKVRGVKRLRVIDASVFPKITNANTNAPTILLAYRGAQKILKKYPSFPLGIDP